MDYSNLKNKTIFDVCKDESLISDIMIVSKETYRKELKSYPLLNALTLIELAELTNNKKLLDAVNAQYKQELESENNE